MVSAESLSRLLYTLYAASTSPELWPQFLQEFTRLMGCSGGGIVQHDMENQKFGLQAHVGLDPAGVALYQAYYGTIDEWREGAINQPENEGVFGYELCSKAQLEKTEFYNDFLVKFDSRLYWTIATEKRTTRLESISLYQGWNDKPPGQDGLDLLQLILPHLKAALRTRRQLAAADMVKKEFQEALNCLDQGIVLLDQSGNCLFVNVVAQRIVDRREGLSIIKSRLWVTSPSERARLNAFVQQSCTNNFVKGKGGSVAVSRPDKKPLSVSVHRFSCDNLTAPRRAAVIVFITDPEQSVKATTEAMLSRYGLTTAELRLTKLLLGGHSLSEAAEQNEVTRETVRSQLKSIFDKTGVRRQTELLRLLSGITSQPSQGR